MYYSTLLDKEKNNIKGTWKILNPITPAVLGRGNRVPLSRISLCQMGKLLDAKRHRKWI